MNAILGKPASGGATVADATDFRVLIKEATTALEVASVALELLGNHRMIESRDFERLVEFVGSAQEAVRKLADAPTLAPKTIFWNHSMARAWCERHPLAEGLSYEINPDGMGRCSVSINRVVEYL